MANNYYWRAVRRIAKKKGIPISKARRLDWEKEVNAERKRRSKGKSLLHPIASRFGRTVSSGTPSKKVRTAVPDVRSTASRTIPRRVRTTGKGKIPVPSGRPASKLKIKEYERLRAHDDEEYEDEIDAEEQWSTDWEDDYPDLDHLDDLMDFMEDFEESDDDKYKEPA